MERLLSSKGDRGASKAYAIAILCAVGGLLARLPLNGLLGDRVPWITFFLATSASAAYGGFRPGLLTTLLGAVLGLAFVVAPVGSFRFSDPLQIVAIPIFVCFGALISYLAEQRLEAIRHEKVTRVLFQQTFVSIGDAVIAIDRNQCVQLMNPVAERLTGWTQAEAKGLPIGSIFRIFQESTDTPAEMPVDRILATGQAAGLTNHTELLTRGGDRIPIDDSAAPIRSEDGTVSGVVLVFRDISQRRKQERALEEIHRELTHFVSAATHDIREPLRTMAIYTEMAQRNLHGQVDSDTEEYLRRVSAGAERLAALVDGLLQFTGMRNTDGSTVDAVPVDTAMALSETRRGLELLVRESGATISATALPLVQANFIHVCQLLQNLISNGIKYRRDGIAPKVEISATRSGPDWIFTVRDNGIGIPPKEYSEIFVAFRRLHGPEIRGAGIGLAICKRIVERYGGRIWVTANEGPGSSFHFSLPAVEARSDLSKSAESGPAG